MIDQEHIFAPGARILVRDAQWLVRRVDRTSTGGQALNVIGISAIVRDKEAIFLTEIEKSIQTLDPARTSLVQDMSGSYQASLLYMESQLRKTPPTDENLYIGHKAAMDALPFQLDPAVQALKQPRQRILIADAVGLGKTLEAGILLSELIKRGKGKRILVLAVKSMLTQFQKEMWTRFTIPLIRLDSIGISRIRSRIPTSHNPFYYYDKSIISIDTLKQDAEYRTYIENAFWDIIVIDESHNVAERGHGSSMRAKLAKLLSRRSDTLIMLSATPHDGKAKSFASLMNMLDPTAIADPENYGPDDIKGLYIRRFKKDIQDQVETSFKQRQIHEIYCSASDAEDAAFCALNNLEFTKIDKKTRGSSRLFKITLEKSLFSSPAACLHTIKNRINKIKKAKNPRFDHDIALLENLYAEVFCITKDKYLKYQKLISTIQDKKQGFGWTGKDKKDRLVIFTERIETLKFLHKNLVTDLKLKEKQVQILHGSMSDIDQQQVVEDFGRNTSDVRLLIASDVASEGINLHFLCHRMIHFDIPWSLMVFQQRNGRIDRYGQKNTPEIVYLITKSGNKKIRGDMRILELLIQKDEEAVKNIGDPAEFMGVYNIDEEEAITADAINKGMNPDTFIMEIEKEAFDPMAVLMGNDEPPSVGTSAVSATKKTMSLFPDDYSYFKAAVNHLRGMENIEADFYDDEERIDLELPEDLRRRFRFLPSEIYPEGSAPFILSSNQDTIKAEIEQSRKEEKAWPKIHFLWSLNPVMEWVDDKLTYLFNRHEAPVLELGSAIDKGEIIFLLSGLIPNRKSHPLIHSWFAVCYKERTFSHIESFENLIARTGLGKNRFPNPGNSFNVKMLGKLLTDAIKQAKKWMGKQRKDFESDINRKLNDHLKDLEKLKAKKLDQMNFSFNKTGFNKTGFNKTSFNKTRKVEKAADLRKEKERRKIERIFYEYMEWVQNTMTTENNPYIQVIAVFVEEGLKTR